jgi:conjugative transfer region protein TrbK
MRTTMTMRTAGLFAVAAAIAASAMNLQHAALSPAGHADVAATVPDDPFAQELARCNTLGMAAKDDARCQAAWAANRLRFFAPFLTHLSGPAANTEPRVPK